MRDSPCCTGMHVVKIYHTRSRRFFGWFVAIFTCLLPSLNAFWRCIQLRYYVNIARE
ncbi:hypothetical protein JYA26_004494, partial [Shigella flexneri]|nr:hypothetical protein [Shigella flexneri]